MTNCKKDIRQIMQLSRGFLMLKLEEKQRELSERNNKEELELLNSEKLLSSLKVKCQFEMVNASKDVSSFNEFRASCLKIVRLYNKFKSGFLDEFEDPENINNFAKLKNPRQLLQASNTFQDFVMNVRSLKIPSETGVPDDFAEYQSKVIQKSETVENHLNDLIVDIEIQRDDYEDMKENSERCRAALVNIFEKYQNIKKDLGGMDCFIEKFNIPTSNIFELAIDQQLKKLSLISPQLAAGNTCPAISPKPDTKKTMETYQEINISGLENMVMMIISLMEECYEDEDNNDFILEFSDLVLDMNEIWKSCDGRIRDDIEKHVTIFMESILCAIDYQ